MNTTITDRKNIVDRLQSLRTNFGGTDAQYAKRLGINSTSYSAIKNGKLDSNIIKETKWIDLAKQLGIKVQGTTAAWAFARTEVFDYIEQEVSFCQQAAKSLMLVDEPEIGKSVAGEYLAKSLKNCFYIDCSQSKTRTIFIRAIAKELGVGSRGTYNDLKIGIKRQLRNLFQPVVILDEAGDLDYSAFLELKELWNATSGTCGWYMMGSDGLRTKMERGIRNGKAGFREMFSRYNGKYMSIVPTERNERQLFYDRLITDVLTVNISDPAHIPGIVRKCISSDAAGEIGGLRRAETTILMKRYDDEKL